MKLLLIDGYALLFRAFYSSRPLSTLDGLPTGALYGFTRMVLNLLDSAQPDYVLVALDAEKPTFRHDNYADYKANRGAAPDELRAQTRTLRELLAGLSIPQYEHAGYEADDILGTLAVHGAERGLEVTIVTGDGDMLQLVNEHVAVMLTRRGVSDLECFTPETVLERYGFGPALIPDYKGLRGDSSDNIPGVPGIGEKTAMSLLAKFGGLESLYERLEEVTPPRIRELLATHKEAAFHSRELARIIVDLPVGQEFEACRYSLDDPAKRAAAVATLQRFEFKSLVARYADEGSPIAQAEAALTPQSFDLRCAASAAELRAWLEQRVAASRAKEDIATTALLWDEAAGLTLGAEETALNFSGDIGELRDWLEDAAALKIVHDAKTLLLALAGHGIALQGVVADTFLMGYLLEPARQQHPIAHLAEKYLRRTLHEPALPEEEKKSKGKKKAAPASLFEEAPEETCAPAGPSPQQLAIASAACAMQELYPALMAELRAIDEERLFTEMELPLVEVLARMEQCGMLLDVAQLRQLGELLNAEALRLQGEIWELSGEEFNIGSTRQLQTILFDKLGLARGRSIKTGHSTDVHTLEKLAEEHDIVRLILEYRATTKLKTTYVDALLGGMDPRTHRIHTNLNQTGAVSGRLSSSNPNLQNIPVRTEQGRLIRKAFIAPPGYVLLKADYSQIELRILAHITGDAPLVEAFQAGADVHARTAADIYQVPVEQVDSEMRRKAKMTNYAIAYGVSGFGLAKQLGTGSAKEAQEIINQYFTALPGVKQYIDDTMQFARNEGYVKTLLGRRRPLPDILSPRQQERAATERVAINHPIQGTAADAMKIAMLALADALRAERFTARMIMQVHDELVFEVREEEVPALTPLVARLMREAPTQEIGLRVPLEVDVGAGSNWDESKG